MSSVVYSKILASFVFIRFASVCFTPCLITTQHLLTFSICCISIFRDRTTSFFVLNSQCLIKGNVQFMGYMTFCHIHFQLLQPSTCMRAGVQR